MESIVSECTLNKFFKRRQEQLAMFFWVQGVRRTLPTVSVQKAISNYLDYYNIDGDTKALETEYGRMMNELIEAEKTT